MWNPNKSHETYPLVSHWSQDRRVAPAAVLLFEPCHSLVQAWPGPAGMRGCGDGEVGERRDLGLKVTWLWVNTYENSIFSGLFTFILTQLFWCEQKGYYWFWPIPTLFKTRIWKGNLVNDTNLDLRWFKALWREVSEWWSFDGRNQCFPVESEVSNMEIEVLTWTMTWDLRDIERNK